MLGVDLGTTATKGVLVDGAGRLVAEASCPVALHSAHPGWAEAETADWWANLCRLVPELLAAAHAGAEDIAVVSTSGMVPAVVLLDAGNRALGPAALQNDARATAEIELLAGRLAGVDLVARTGSALSQQSVAPTLLWLQRHQADRWARARAVVGSYDWLAIALGAPPHVERNWALESGLYELAGLLDTEQLSGALVPEVLGAVGLSADLLGAVRASGQLVGEVSAEAAASTGLDAGTPIAVGGADHVLSAYAAGLANPGDWLLKLGGAGDILVVTDEVFLDPRLYLDAHPKNGHWLPNGCMATSGSLLRWLQAVLGEADVAVLEKQAEASEPAQVLCLPYFLGEKSPIHDPLLRGAFLGLHLGHGRGDVYRAALEGVAYGFRHHVEVFAERGVSLGRARVTNGGSRSRVWKQILADVLGVPLEPVLDHPGASLGAALAGGIAVGLLADWRAGEELVRYGAAIEPNLELRGRYDDAYGCYREAGGALTGVSHRWAGRSEAMR